MKLEIRPHWDVDPPTDFTLNPDGTLTFQGRVGDILLPPDYLAFLRFCDGMGVRSDDSWFISRCDAGPKILQLEYLRELFGVMNST
jgi:hypothetical protein